MLGLVPQNSSHIFWKALLLFSLFGLHFFDTFHISEVQNVYNKAGYPDDVSRYKETIIVHYIQRGVNQLKERNDGISEEAENAGH